MLCQESSDISSQTLCELIGNKNNSMAAVIPALDSPNKVTTLQMHSLPIFARRVSLKTTVDF